MSDEPIEVRFPVFNDGSGYPPVNEELIWCLPNEGDVFTVDNIPFYAMDTSLGDDVLTEVRDGERWFKSLVKASANTTVRVFARKPSFSSMIVPRMQAFGGLTEKMEGSDLVAVSFPPSADLGGALAFLDEETEHGNLAFEEAAVRYR